MAEEKVNGSASRPRPGAQALLLLAAPLNLPILRTLTAGPRQQTELRREAGSPPPTTLRTHLNRLVSLGAIAKRRRDSFPGTLEYELTGCGCELLAVAAVLERWLAAAPGGVHSLADGPARSATKALVEAWSTTMIGALAAEALSLTQLDGIIGALSYPALQRRLAALSLAGIVEVAPRGDRAAGHALSSWGRAGIAPLAAAARWEGRHMASPPRVDRRDVEAAFLLAAPVLRLTAGTSGCCRLTAELGSGDHRRPAGVLVTVEDGAVRSLTTSLRGAADAWVHGSPSAWLEAAFGPDAEPLQLGGHPVLTRGLLRSIRVDAGSGGGEPLPAP